MQKKSYDFETLERHSSQSILQVCGEFTRDYIALELVTGYKLLGERWRDNQERQSCLEKFFESPASGNIYSLHFVTESDCFVSQVTEPDKHANCPVCHSACDHSVI